MLLNSHRTVLRILVESAILALVIKRGYKPTIEHNRFILSSAPNIVNTLSAIFAIGALVEAASLTIFIICESVVSSPTLVALHLRTPDSFNVPEETFEPRGITFLIDFLFSFLLVYLQDYA